MIMELQLSGASVVEALAQLRAMRKVRDRRDRAFHLLRYWYTEQGGTPYWDDQEWGEHVCLFCFSREAGEDGQHRHAPECIWPELEQLLQEEP